MIRPITIILIIMRVYPSCLMCQTNEDDFISNYPKYWNYKYNLLGDRIDPAYWEAGMVRVGDCAGCSQPTIEVHPRYHNGMEEFNSAGICGDQNVLPSLIGYSPGAFRYAENLIQLGKYLIALSTEYKLLKSNQEPTTEVEIELYYALKVVERHDLFAEAQTGSSGNLNGFLARDYMPANFICTTKEMVEGYMASTNNTDTCIFLRYQ